MNLFDYKKLLKKVLGFFAAGLLLFAIGTTLVILVLQPIIWVTNMLGRISEMLDFNPAGSERITGLCGQMFIYSYVLMAKETKR